MDALNFLKERERMCRTCYDKEMECAYCPANKTEKCLFWEAGAWEKAIEIVEKWSKEHPKKNRKSEFLKNYPKALIDKRGNKEHPKKNRKSEFLKNYPKALIDKRGNPIFCVKALGYEEDCGPQDNCLKCWNKEVK